MKILYITTIASTINAFLIPHIKLLIDQGHTVDIACNKVKNLNPILKEYGCEVHEVEFSRVPLKIDNVKAYSNLKKILKKNEYDLIHTHTPIASFIARLACKNLKNLKVIYTAHGFHFYEGAPLKNWLIYFLMEKLASRWTDLIITINEEDFQFAKKKLTNKRLKKISKINGVGVSLEQFSKCSQIEKITLRKKLGFKEDDFILFYAAELNANKNQELLIRVINELRKDIPNIKLLLAGRGPLQNYYLETINKLNLNNNIFILGYRKDIPNLLNASDIAVASSKREGLPVNIMEAMASGLPIVATNTRGHNDLVKTGYNGYLIEKNKMNEFVLILKKLYETVEEREKFGNNNLAIIENYNINNVKQELAEIYRGFM